MYRVGRVMTAIVLGMALVVPTGCTSDGEGASEEPIRIGAVLSLSGTYAALGESEKRALDLEVAAINKAGGIEGRRLELIIEDDATDEAKAVAATTKLIDQDGVVAVIGATGTGQTMAMRGDVVRAGVPQISLAGGTVVTGELDPNVFQTPWSNTLVVPFVLEAMKRAGHDRIALLSDSGGYGKDGRSVITEAAATAGLEIVADETFNPGDADLSAQLTRIKSSEPEAVLLWTAGREAATAVRTAKELGIVAPLWGGSGQARREFIDGAADAAEGFTFGTGRSLVPRTWGEGSAQYEVVSDFAQRYRETYGEEPDIFAGHAFDAVRIVTDALSRSGGDATPSRIRDAIEQTSGLMGYGGTFSFGPEDHNGLSEQDLQLYTIEAGAWKPVEQ